jgi:O-antigen/teichoic acid export membrane protein
LDFADTIGSFPENIAINFGRVAFAGYSRIQKQKELLFKSISKSVSTLSILLYIFPVLIFCFGSEFVKSFYTPNWHFAIPALYWFSTAAFFLPIMASLGQGILAIGKSKEIFRATFITTVIGWILALILLNQVGFVGIAISNLFFEIILCIFYLSILRNNGLNFPLLKILFPKTIVVLVSIILGFTLNAVLSVNIFIFILKSVIVSSTYFILMYFFAKNDLLELFNLVSLWRKR